MDDWRLNGQEDYLMGVRLKKKLFKADGWYDHEHCEFCWAKISEYPDTFEYGYCTDNGRHWICEECYTDFKDTFKWILSEDIDESEEPSKSPCLIDLTFIEKSNFLLCSVDEIVIPKDREIVITITKIGCADTGYRYSPIINLIGEGYTKNQVGTMLFGKTSKKAKEQLVFYIDAPEKHSVSIIISSHSGLIDIAYQWENYDKENNILTRGSSDECEMSYGMKKQIISDNKNIYYCKNPLDSTDDFNSFAFSVEWELSDA